MVCGVVCVVVALLYLSCVYLQLDNWPTGVMDCWVESLSLVSYSTMHFTPIRPIESRYMLIRLSIVLSIAIASPVCIG
jgi:hypothetical protein